MTQDPTDRLARLEAERAHLELQLTQRRKALREVEELSRLNEALASRAAQLGRSNAALEDFAYAASHDLQAPLRAVANFAAWIAEELPPEAEVQQHVRRLLDRVERLRVLHRDLLMYARAGREQGEIQPVQLTTLVAETWSRMAESADAHLQVEQLPEAELHLAADPLASVIQALFDNAVQHHDGGRVEVVVRARLENGLVLEVEDNGPGIEPRFAEQIFRVLETLRPRDAGAGSGMGLAIARKRAETAGGRMFLVPRTGRGALFQVEWPVEGGS